MCKMPLPTNLLLLFALVLPILAVVAGLPSHPRIFAVLNNAAHVPVFGALAVVIFQLVSRHSRRSRRFAYASAFLTAVFVGGVVEIVQPAFGRGSDLRDVWTDALGACAGLAIVAISESRRRYIPGTILAVVLAAAAWPVLETALAYRERSRQAPALLELSTPFDLVLLWTHGFEASMSELPSPWRKPGDPLSMKLRITRDAWRVLALTEPIPDWRAYGRLLVDLTNPETQPHRLTLRVHDRTHNNEHHDRFNRSIDVPAETRMLIEIPLADVASAPSSRRMNLSQVAGVMIFASSQPELGDRCFYVTRIWLEPRAN
jgi:VanZ family protein